MKNISVIIGLIIGFVVICVAFLNTILQVIEGLAGYFIWIAYFLILGIVYEFIMRTYRLIIKIKNRNKKTQL